MADLSNTISTLANASLSHSDSIDSINSALLHLVNTVDRLVDRQAAQQRLIDRLYYEVVQKEGLTNGLANPTGDQSTGDREGS